MRHVAQCSRYLAWARVKKIGPTRSHSQFADWQAASLSGKQRQNKQHPSHVRASADWPWRSRQV